LYPKQKENKISYIHILIFHTLIPSRQNGIRQQPKANPKKQIAAEVSHTATPFLFLILVTID